MECALKLQVSCVHGVKSGAQADHITKQCGVDDFLDRVSDFEENTVCVQSSSPVDA